MTLREVITEAWYDLTAGQRVVAVVLAGVLGMVIASGWLSSATAWIETRRAERKADEALKKAAQVAAAVIKKEKEIAEVEKKRDEKQKDAEAAAANTDRDRAEHDRAVSEPRTDNPSAEQLCRELADLGYACYR